MFRLLKAGFSGLCGFKGGRGLQGVRFAGLALPGWRMPLARPFCQKVEKDPTPEQQIARIMGLIEPHFTSLGELNDETVETLKKTVADLKKEEFEVIPPVLYKREYMQLKTKIGDVDIVCFIEPMQYFAEDFTSQYTQAHKDMLNTLEYAICFKIKNGRYMCTTFTYNIQQDSSDPKVDVQFMTIMDKPDHDRLREGEFSIMKYASDETFNQILNLEYIVFHFIRDEVFKQMGKVVEEELIQQYIQTHFGARKYVIFD